MAVFSTNLVVYTHTDFEQTFLLEDNQSNSAKDLTGFTGTARFKRQIQDLSDPTAFNISFPNRALGKVRIGLTATQSAKVKPGKYFYEILLKDSMGDCSNSSVSCHRTTVQKRTIKIEIKCCSS